MLAGEAAQIAIATGTGLPFLGGPEAFSHLRLIRADGSTAGICPVGALPIGWDAPVLPLTRSPPPFAGLVPRLGPGGPLVMGIVNVTPDSFSGDGVPPAAAIAQGQAMLGAGADILDIGGESTRPGAAPVPPEDEIARILPVIEALAPLGPVSVDTRNAATMQAALAAGARIVNDVSALRHDPAAAGVVAAAAAPAVLMHMRGDDPRSMQAGIHYDDVVLAVARHLDARLAAAAAAGIPRDRIALDPGIGFGKTGDHNLALLRRLPILAGLGCPILVGVSRKAFIGRLSGTAEPARRVPGSLAAALFAAERGAAILRVHDVAETVAALRVWRACRAG